MIKWLLVFLLMFVPVADAQQYLWRYQTHATDCTAGTSGKATDLCYEQDSKNLYKCVPSSGDCDTVGEWLLIRAKLDSDPTGCNAGSYVTDISDDGTLTCTANPWFDGGTNVYLTPTTDNVAIGTTTPNASLLIENVSTGDSFRVNDSASDTTPFVISSSGNVGIGSTLPMQSLDTGSGIIMSPSIANGRVFNVKKYGAKGDGIQVIDGAISTGTTTFTSASASFTSDDVGKVITIQNAGGSNVDLTSTISSINSGTSVEIADTASATVSSSYSTYGTDDCTAIRSTITAIGSDTTKGISATMYFPSGTYMVNCTFSQSNNSQIGFPANIFTAAVTSIRILGENIPAPNAKASNGSIIYGTKYGTDGTYAVLSVTDSAGGGTGNIARVNVSLENIRLRTVQDPTHTFANFSDIDQAQGDNVVFDTSSTYNSPALPTHNDSYALKLPNLLAGNVSGGWRNLKIKTYYNGVQLGEHSLIWSAFIVQGVNAMHFFECRYPAQVFQVAVESVQNAVLVTSAGSTNSYLYIYDLDMEHVSGTFANVTDIKDESNLGIGTINYSIFDAGGGSSITKSGAKSISLLNMKTGQREFRPTTGDHFRVVTSAADSSTSGALYWAMQNDNTAVDIGSRLGGYGWAGSYSTTGTQYVYGAVIEGIAQEAFASNAAGTDIRIRTASTGSTTLTERMRIRSNGNVGIGTTTPTGILQLGTATSGLVFTSSGGITSAGNVGISTTKPNPSNVQITNGIITTWN